MENPEILLELWGLWPGNDFWLNWMEVLAAATF